MKFVILVLEHIQPSIPQHILKLASSDMCRRILLVLAFCKWKQLAIRLNTFAIDTETQILEFGRMIISIVMFKLATGNLPFRKKKGKEKKEPRLFYLARSWGKGNADLNPTCSAPVSRVFLCIKNTWYLMLVPQKLKVKFNHAASVGLFFQHPLWFSKV